MRRLLHITTSKFLIYHAILFTILGTLYYGYTLVDELKHAQTTEMSLRSAAHVSEICTGQRTLQSGGMSLGVSDAWGNSMRLEDRDGALLIVSNGRDGAGGTQDDIALPMDFCVGGTPKAAKARR